MGSSGGGGFFDDPQKVASKLRKAEQDAKDQFFHTDVEGLLGSVLTNANDRDVDATASHLRLVKQALEKEVGGVVDLLFGGSVAKNTYVEGMSDVDALVVIDNSELAGKNPQFVCDYIQKRLSERLKSSVEADGFAIDVHFSDVTVQVIPVMRRGADYLLPNDECTAWSRVRPQAFAQQLTATNQACGGKVVPTIKLAKVLLRDLPDERRPSGYHLENLAVKAFEGYKGPYTPREMLHHFFSKAPDLIRTPIKDRTGQSSHVDEYLGSKDSMERLVVADSVARVGRRLTSADDSKSIEQWKRLFGIEK